MKLCIIDLLGLAYDGTTLSHRGLGGSESAVILISKELAKIGFEVTVYNSCLDSQASSGIYDGVTYIDHSQFIDDTDYDIVICSRTIKPFFQGNQYSRICNVAKYTVLWMHDTFCDGDEHIEHMLITGVLDEVYNLSDFHTNYTLNCNHGNHRNFEVLKHKIFQTRNGVVKRREVDISKKDRNHFVYNASFTKGVRPLLDDIWPHVKREIPDAHLTIIGGYYRFREGAEPDQQEKDLRAYIELTPKEFDVTFTGVISQSEIADILCDATFFLYPCDFPETFGISTLEAILYKTIPITSRFGGLEEVAVDLASYKINYAAVPNSLFPNIDRKSQAKNYIETAIKAYNDTYLLQQKQNYCDIIDGIYGWDTIALQWKQQIYLKLEKYLPVDEYRKVSKINDKVNRVFGKRFLNDSKINEYRSYSSKEKDIIVISPFWNAQDYIKECILSVAQQDYDNYTHYLIDDYSDDNSFEIALETIKSLPESIKDKFNLIRNQQNKGAIRNQLETFQKVFPESIVMLLDGDDFLISNNTIFKFYNDLYNEGYEFTYGSMFSLADEIPLVAQDYPEEVKQNKTYRDHKFNWKIPYTHLRTFLGKHCMDLPEEPFKVNGEWMKAGADNPLFYEIIERVEPDKIKAVKEIVCYYNDINPLNDYKIRGTEQNQNAGTSYEKKVMKKILIAVPTNKYIEPQTFKSIYDLEIPDGYETEFQFFYGYQIDQIRNLIANWGLRYHYLFCVDSDIELPSDTLVKMLNHDKDIISGVYIQRLEDRCTPELFYINDTGGVSHYDINALEKGLMKIDACGFGCVLIKSDVLRAMEYPHFVYQSSIDFQHTVSEDTYFCRKASSLGFEIYADTTIVCNHIGQKIFRPPL